MEQNENIVPKDEWVTPQLICMGRSNPEETVLGKCHEAQLGTTVVDMSS